MTRESKDLVAPYDVTVWLWFVALYQKSPHSVHNTGPLKLHIDITIIVKQVQLD